MPGKEEYLLVLKERLSEYLRTLEINREKLQAMTEVIKKTEENATYIQRLLEAEGLDLKAEGLNNNLGKSIADIAFDVMQRLPKNRAVHYRDLSDLMIKEGNNIPGKDPAANLITHLGRDIRFKRTGRGLYALAEWNLKAKSKRRTKRRKSRTVR
jgi:hypothetical protein